MESLDLELIKKRSISSVLTLTIRTVLLQIVAFAGYFFITIFLDQKELGIFILVSAIVDVLAYFSDIGLAAALIQKKEKLTLKEIRSTFTIQQALVILAITILFIISPLIKRAYSLGEDGMNLFYAFMVAFFLSSLKTIPTVLLERKLKFTKIIIPQIAETILFNFSIVFLAWKGWGVRSYSIAVLIRAFSGFLLIYILAPWRIGFAFSRKALKKLLKFGIPYQTNTFLAVVKDKFMILLLGGIIGKEGIGLIGWAEKWANMPLRYFLDNTTKVAFPTFARLQHNKEKLKRAIEASLYFLTVLIFPCLAGLSLVSGPLVRIIPRYLKWQPALIPLYLYSLVACWATVSTLLTNALAAVGKIKVVFKLMIMWTVLTWLFTPALAIKFGFIGVPLAAVLVSFSSIVAILVAKKYFKFNLVGSIIPALVSSGIMSACLLIIRNKLPSTTKGMGAQIIFGVLIYIASMVLINKDKLFKEAKILLSYVKS